MTIFDFLDIKREILDVLSKQTEDGGRLVQDIKYAEGTVRSRKDGDYRKQGGKWVKIYSGTGRGASLAVTHAVKKIKAAKSVDELMDLVNSNISRFYDKNGKLLPVVSRLKDAVNESKMRINAEKNKKPETKKKEPETAPKSRAEMQKRYNAIIAEKFKLLDEYKEELNKFPKFDSSKLDSLTVEVKKETEKKNPDSERLDYLSKALMFEKSRLNDYSKDFDAYKEKLQSELDKKITTLDSEQIKLKKEMSKKSRFPKKEEAPAAPATAIPPEFTPMKKPDVIEGRWNGKIYGNAKYGYRVYVDGKEKKITEEQKKQVDAWQKQEREKKDIVKNFSFDDVSGNVAQISLRNPAIDINHIATLAIKKPEQWEKYKQSNNNVFLSSSNLEKLEQNAKGEQEQAFVQKLKTDKDFAEKANKEYIALVDNTIRKMKDEREREQEREQAREQAYNNRDSQIENYIKAHGTPDIVKNGFWNGKVYGSEKSGYSVYVDGKKKTLSEADKKQFGL